MKRADANSKQGFTIIEVVLVLAIAGLIMLMVFVALPAMQRSQRNTQRKEDLSRVISALGEYQSNNHNKVPNDFSTTGTFYASYLGGENGFSGPNNAYAFVSGGDCTSSTEAGGTKHCGGSDATKLSSGDEQIVYFTNAKCNGADSTDQDAGQVVEPASATTKKLERKLAFVIKMEGSSATNGPLYCVNN